MKRQNAFSILSQAPHHELDSVHASGADLQLFFAACAQLGLGVDLLCQLIRVAAMIKPDKSAPAQRQRHGSLENADVTQQLRHAIVGKHGQRANVAELAQAFACRSGTREQESGIGWKT